MRPIDDISNAELALAHELRQEGCCWKLIAIGLNCDFDSLCKAVTHALEQGIATRSDPRQTDLNLVRTILRIRRDTRIGWQSIADHVGIDKAKLQRATYRYTAGARKHAQEPSP